MSWGAGKNAPFFVRIICPIIYIMLNRISTFIFKYIIINM